jgi:hypothetical protein
MPFAPLLWFSRVDFYQLHIEKVINRAMIHAICSPSLILSSGLLSASYREVNKQSDDPCVCSPSLILSSVLLSASYTVEKIINREMIHAVCSPSLILSRGLLSASYREVNKQSDDPCRLLPFSDTLDWIPISFI